REAAGGDDTETALGVRQGQRARVEGHDPGQLLQDLLDRVLEPGLAVDGLQDVLERLRFDPPQPLRLHREGERHAAPLAGDLLAHGVQGLGAMGRVQPAETLLHLPKEAFHVHDFADCSRRPPAGPGPGLESLAEEAVDRQRILFVCTANVDRSRTAEDLYRADPRYEVLSA